MTLYYAINKIDNLLYFSAETNHHLLNVLRVKTNDLIDVCYQNIIYNTSIVINNKTIASLILNNTNENNELPFSLNLIIALPKGDKLDDIIKHSVELGVDNIYLWNSTRSLKKFTNNDFLNKKVRLDKIILNAAEQSRRNKLPNIILIETLPQLIKLDFDLKLVAYENNLQETNALNSSFNSTVVLIGSEGGLTENEYKTLLKAGYQNFALGKRILRTETAVYASLAIIAHKKEYDF
ncbi:MAG: 16S rRNA (uracil(1498)-N(3))-methyltransferase [Bacillales bacterium]|jgi:16S rRNA (uracil1498-N3)-methyltransferase|nr:16S rRNA (uracil(1498)-N(3))-methyltransferase [Bacillales bacterium]